MNRRVFNLFKFTIIIGASTLAILFCFLMIKANNIHNEAWNAHAIRSMDWKEYSKDFRIVATSEFEQSTISVLLASRTMSKYNQARRINQLEHHFLGFIVYIYSRIFVSDAKALPRILAFSYLGSNIEGFSNASKYYFDKNIKEINLAESALLLTIWKAPGRYNPLINLDLAYKTRNSMLRELKAKDVTKEAISQAINSPIVLYSKVP